LRIDSRKGLSKEEVYMECLEALLSRRSMRHYLVRPVGELKVEREEEVFSSLFPGLYFTSLLW
jgi:hypothetical protein